MPSFRRLALSSAAPTLPSPSMPPLALIEPNGPHQAQAALDTLGRSCRVLAGTGLHGSGTFTIPDGDPPDDVGPARIYPDEETARVVLRMSSVPLTPGHVVALRVLALPSGPTQHEIDTNEFIDGGKGGVITIAVTYTNSDADTRTVETSISPPPSGAIYGAEPGSGANSVMRLTAAAWPWAAVPSLVDLEKWTRGADVKASFVVSYAGSPRVVDLQVVERPSQIVVDHASSEWPSAMYVGAGGPYGELPSDYPVTQLSSTDPGGGLEGIRRALDAHGEQLGPCLAWLTSAREASGTLSTWISYDGGTGDDEAPPFAVSASTYRNLPYTPAPPLTGLPGFMLGGYARQASQGNAWYDGRTGVLPVWLFAWAKGSGAVVQFRAGDDEWSAVNVSVAGVSYAAYLAPGWIEVGVGPEDAPLGRFFALNTVGTDCRVRYAGVFMRAS